MPSVASTYVPPGRTFKYWIASCKRTGTCRPTASGTCSPWGANSSSPLEVKACQRLLVFRRQRILIHVLTECVMVGNFQVMLHPENHHVAHNLGRIPQNLRNQYPTLRVDLSHLAVIVHSVQQLLFRRIEVGDLRQLLFNLFPLLQGVNLGHPTVLAGDVELGPILLVNQALKIRRQLEATLLVHSRWVISAKHSKKPAYFTSDCVRCCLTSLGLR